MKADYHMHTSFSRDSQFDMEDEIKCAIANGLEEICFTDHVDYLRDNHSWGVDYQKQFEAFTSYKKKYQHQITLKRGVEFGMQSHMIDHFQKDFNENEFDFVILSCHEVDDREFWNNDYQTGKNQQEINELYYQEILTCMTNYKDYSVLGHLDAIKRYDPYGEYADEKVEPLFREILQLAIQDGKGIEINTSSFRYGLSDLTPSRRILELYHELGGRILTFGSDTHKPEHVGYKIEEVKQIAREIGFTEFCTFEKMKPIFHSL